MPIWRVFLLKISIKLGHKPSRTPKNSSLRFLPTTLLNSKYTKKIGNNLNFDIQAELLITLSIIVGQMRLMLKMGIEIFSKIQRIIWILHYYCKTVCRKHTSRESYSKTTIVTIAIVQRSKFTYKSTSNLHTFKCTRFKLEMFQQFLILE